MDGGRDHGGGSLSLGIARWKAVRGGTYQDGTPITKPLELQTAEVVDGICQRYNCLPSQVLSEDVGILRLLDIVEKGRIEDKASG